MQQVFLKVLNMSISAGWLILAIVLLRFLLKKAPRNISCMLWAMVAFRLLCPFSIESAFSLVPKAETIPADIVYQQKPNVDTGIDAVNQIVNPVVEYSFAPAELTSVNPIQVALELGGWVWLIVMAAMLIYTTISYVRLRRRTAASIRLEDNVYVCDNVDSPFVLGIVKPRIILNSSLESSQIGPVVAHEKAHLKRLDHCWKLLGFVVLSLHWFNPLVWLAYALFCRDIELACDESVISKMNIEAKKVYSNALLSCSIKPAKMLVCPLAFGEVSVKQRIKAVLAYKKASVWMVVLAAAVCAVLAVCFLSDPKEPDALAFTAADVHDLKRAVLQSEYGDREITQAFKLRLLEEKLNTGEAMKANPACPFEMTLQLYRADGTQGTIQLASDGCEVFYSGGAYYDYGINETGSVLLEFGFEHFRQENEFDEQGRLIKKTGYNWFEPFGIVEYGYDGDLLVSHTYRDGSGKLQGYFEFEYNEQGKEIYQRHYLPDEEGKLQLERITETIYDEDGNFKETHTYRPDGSSEFAAGSPGIYSVGTSHADGLYDELKKG